MQPLIRFAFVMALGGALQASGQSLGIQMPQERAGNPTAKPEPRRLINSDPISLYRRLVSPSPEDRGEALRLLGHKEIDASESLTARLYAVHLDRRAELEYILLVAGWPAGTIATVLYQNGKAWWAIGDFTYWLYWDANEAERFVELREIVWDGRKEIIVRDHEGGTGISETWLSIYRMQDGRLYRVFRTLEDGYDSHQGISEYEHRTLEYPEHYLEAPAFLVTRYVKRTEPAEGGRPVRVTRKCSVFRWDAAGFAFVEDKIATPKLCPDPTGKPSG
jgi:hypothetical protein